MVDVAGTAPGSGPARPDPGVAAEPCPATEIDLRLFGMLVALAVHPHRLPHHVRRHVPEAREHGHPGRPGLGDGDHGHGHGPDHRVAQHRPVRRVDRRRGRDGLRPAPDEWLPAHRARPRQPVHVDRRPCPRHRIGAFIGGFQGFIIAYIGVPSFIVTLGGLLSLRGTVWLLSSGAAVSGLHSEFRLIGGGAAGSIGGILTWALGDPRLPRHHRPALLQPPPATALRVPASPDVGGGAARRPRLRAGDRRLAFANANFWPPGPGDASTPPTTASPNRRVA